MEVRIKTDTMTPQMKRMLRKIQNRRPVLREIGTEASSMARRAFTDESLRPTRWDDLAESTKAKKAAAGKGSSPLIWSGTMARSPRVSHVDNEVVHISSDRAEGAYSIAAIHQLGAPKRKIPPRPFFPFTDGKATPRLRQRIQEIITRWGRKLGFS